MYAYILRDRHHRDVVDDRLTATVIDLSRRNTAQTKLCSCEWRGGVSVALPVIPPREAAKAAVS
jgi:hypothetical protein